MVQTPPDPGDPSPSLHSIGEKAESHGSDLEKDLWLRFAEATNPKAFLQSWLSLQCRILKGIRSAMVLLGTPDRGPFTPVAIWPTPDFSVKHLAGIAESALRERRGLLVSNDKDSTPQPEKPVVANPQIAYPIEVSGRIHGVVVLEADRRFGHETQVVMRQLHWGAAWLEVMLRRADALKAEETNQRLQDVLDSVTSALEHERYQQAAMAFVTRLAMKLECDRVSLGFKDGDKLHVSALSHSAEFGKRMNLIRAIGSAMDEAIDQGAVIVYPLPHGAAPMVTRAHAELARQHGAGTICTIPLKTKERLMGGMTLERPAQNDFDEATVELAETIATLVGPILEAKRKEERWLIAKAGESLTTQLKKLVGPGHLAVKLCATALLALVIFFWFTRGDYRVTGKTVLEGTVQRMVSAPFNSYIAEAGVRPGDIVKQGELLCLLDDRDLKLERLKCFTQEEQLVKQYHEALAKHDRPQIQITKAKIDQAEAQIALLDEQLLRTKVVAPFDGVIMKGDLSQSLGAPVERGQVLFEVAPLESYRVIVEVDERDIADVGVGQRGELVLPSVPGDAFSIAVDKITPVSTAKEGRNYFRVEAHLMEKISERLRPGMEGVGKITIDRRKLIWIWTHELIDWLRLKLWSWWP